MDRCYECVHCKFHKGAVRGSMDCDPDEYTCDYDADEFYDEDATECEMFREALDWGEPDPDAWYDEMREERYNHE